MKRKLILLSLTFLFSTNISFGQVTVDILVAYTTYAKNYVAIQTDEVMIATIENAVIDANASFVDSVIK